MNIQSDQWVGMCELSGSYHSIESRLPYIEGSPKNAFRRTTNRTMPSLELIAAFLTLKMSCRGGEIRA